MKASQSWGSWECISSQGGHLTVTLGIGMLDICAQLGSRLALHSACTNLYSKPECTIFFGGLLEFE